MSENPMRSFGRKWAFMKVKYLYLKEIDSRGRSVLVIYLISKESSGISSKGEINWVVILQPSGVSLVRTSRDKAIRVGCKSISVWTLSNSLSEFLYTFKFTVCVHALDYFRCVVLNGVLASIGKNKKSEILGFIGTRSAIPFQNTPLIHPSIFITYILEVATTIKLATMNHLCHNMHVHLII